MNPPKTIQDMTEDQIMMVFAQMWDWEVDARTKAGTKTFKFQALLNMPTHPHDLRCPREYWTEQQAKREKDLPGYRNFPWGKFQVFCGDVWIGETEDDLKAARKLAHDYVVAQMRAANPNLEVPT